MTETKAEMRVKRIVKVMEQDKDGKDQEKWAVVFKDTEGTMTLKFANDPEDFEIGTWYQISVKPVNKKLDEFQK
jgi:hypothetical protein